jgi:gas vesicle protein
MNKNSKKFAIGAIIAAGVGYVTGILTAPKSGKETREDVKNAAINAKREAEKKLKSLHSEIIVQLERAKRVTVQLQSSSKKELESMVESARRAKEKARDMLTALHDGDVEDKDLKSAIDEVNQAVTHLRAYLDKHE